MIAGGAALRAQQAGGREKSAFAAGDEKILAEVRDHNEIMANLEYLSDMIGQRLTGSENLKKANDWTQKKFAEYGLDECAPGKLVDRAYLDAGYGDGTNCKSGGTSVDDCVVRVGGEYGRAGARSGGVREGQQD